MPTKSKGTKSED
uniref:Uncharacterized protein n=1 Tax=Arundo donax TaxID=35708 RepID=A0A0A9CEY4_ARUDO